MAEEKKTESKPKPPKAGEITQIRIFRDRSVVRFVGWDANGIRLTQGQESERFPSMGSAKRVLHQRYPQARITRM